MPTLIYNMTVKSVISFYDQNVGVPTPKSYVKALTPNGMIFENRVLGR